MQKNESIETPVEISCPEYAYCVFCETGKEEYVASRIGHDPRITVLVPTIEHDEHRNGTWEKCTRKMLPGYLFLYSAESENCEELKRIDGVIKALKYDDKDYKLTGSDRQFAEWLYRNNGRIGMSSAIKEGTKIRIVGGPLLSYAGSILEVKRSKRIAKVAVTLGDVTREIWMGFEWLTSTDIA